MKCPVCDQEYSAMLCPRCGYDASRDYARYPTFGLMPKMGTDIKSIASAIEHLYALIEEWKERLHKQQAFEEELQRKDIIINNLYKELRETRTSLVDAQAEIERLKNPRVQQDPQSPFREQSFEELFAQFLKY